MPCKARVRNSPIENTTISVTKEPGDNVVSPMEIPARARAHSSVRSVTRAPQTSANSGAEATSNRNPISVGIRPLVPTGDLEKNT